MRLVMSIPSWMRSASGRRKGRSDDISRATCFEYVARIAGGFAGIVLQNRKEWKQNVMSELNLHDFDHRLCRYVLDNFEPLLHRGMRDEVEGELDDQLLVFLTEENVANDPPLDFLLSWHELLELEITCGILASRRKWTSYSRLHRWYVRTILEIRDGLTQETAEQWARICVEQGQQLEREGLWLPEGIEIVRDWIVDLRDLLLAMGRLDLLPAPEGFHPTPQPQTRNPLKSLQTLKRAPCQRQQN